MGQGPALLLIHGTGASTHSWRALAPLLARHYTVIAPDLPGHGFTESPARQAMSLPGMATAVATLADKLALKPERVIGHSAGAAILIRCCLDGLLQPHDVISLNGALLPFRGHAGVLFPPLAKILFLNPLTPRLLAHSARDPERVLRLIRGTGSELDQAGIDFYARLFASPVHVRATLGMMANWDLRRFAQDLPRLNIPLRMIIGEQDEAVPPTDAERVSATIAKATLVRLPGLGHLAHEEDAETVADAIFQ